MAVAVKGIHVQPSRFAILTPDSDSDENENWHTVSKGTKGKVSGGKSSTKQDTQKQGITKAAAKNAKRKAKKRNQQSSSSDHVQEEPQKEEVFQQWQTKDETSIDQEFQKDLGEALMMSMLDVKKNEEKVSEVQTQKVKPKSKKGITLSLQEFHKTDLNLSSPDSPKKQNEEISNGVDFFDKIQADLQNELKKEQTSRRKVKINHTIQTSESSEDSKVKESVRVAQLIDRLEKKETTVENLRTENDKLLQELQEVKRRNQVLYKMLSKGEIATKSDLLEQVEELSSIKDELTIEIERLHSELEQEKSKNKTLKAELQKTQGPKGNSKT